MNAFLFFVLLALPSHADITFTNTMKDVMASAEPGTLLVFDVDDTLIEPTQDLGSDHWYYYIVKRLKEKEHLTDAAAYDRADAIWARVQESVAVKTVEPETAAWLRARQLAGIKAIALTARVPNLAEITEKQLASVGISFAEKPVWDKDVIVGPEQVMFIRGAIYVGSSDKGASLSRFLRKIGYTPKKIVYVDDKLPLVRSVAEAAAKLGVPFEGFRYGGIDKEAARFERDMKDPDLYCDGQLKK